MRFQKASVKCVPQSSGFEGMLKHIELCGRVSYKSEDKITDDSYNKFITMLITRGHTSPCEHGTVYLAVPKEYPKEFSEVIEGLNKNPYTVVNSNDSILYITTNYRVCMGMPKEFLTTYWCEPTEYHTKRVTFKVICSRGIGYELVRHRVLSFTQESTRYCNYSKDKFGGHLNYIIPYWTKGINEGNSFTAEDLTVDKMVTGLLDSKNEQDGKTLIMLSTYICAETAYNELLKIGGKPQEARELLPNGLKTEVIITGTIPQWEGFLKLRSPKYGAKGAHPDMEVVGDMIYDQLTTKGLIAKIEQKND